MMIGATPAKFTYSGCTTPSAMPPATPASIALPPASRIRKPASAARYWHAATMWRVPMMVGRWAFMLSSVGESVVAGMEWSVVRDFAPGFPSLAISSITWSDDHENAKPTFRSRRRRRPRRGHAVAGRERRTLSRAHDHARRAVRSGRIDRHPGAHRDRAFAAIAAAVRHRRESNGCVGQHRHGRGGSIGAGWLHVPVQYD